MGKYMSKLGTYPVLTMDKFSIILRNRRLQRKTEFTKLNEANMLLNFKVEEVTSLKVEVSKQAELIRHLKALETTLRNENLTIQERYEQERSWNREERIFRQQIHENNDQLRAKVNAIKDQLDPPTITNNPVTIGQQGEEIVINSLRRAFPNNTSIWKTESNHCGDILLKVENTNTHIMFEVKNHKSDNIRGKNNGRDIEKFFEDLDNLCLDPPIHAGVLISLNSTVDPNYPSLEPHFSRAGKPFMFVDCLKAQYPDPVCLLKVIVITMNNHVKLQAERGGSSGNGLRVDNYLKSIDKNHQVCKKLIRSNEVDKKNIECIKAGLDSLKQTLLEDKSNDLKNTNKNTSLINNVDNGDEEIIKNNTSIQSSNNSYKI